MPKKYALFIGRYQTPYLHEGHLTLFYSKIREGIPVLVAVRDVETDEKNPYPAKTVQSMIELQCEEWISAGLMQVIIIPDIVGVYYGRDVGYEVAQIEVPDEIKQISASAIRKQMQDEKAKPPHNQSFGL